MNDCSLLDRLREPKIFDMSMFDWFSSLFGAYLIGKYFLNLTSIFSYCIWMVVWTFFGVYIHYLLGINTMLGYYLGVNPKPIRKKCENT